MEHDKTKLAVHSWSEERRKKHLFTQPRKLHRQKNGKAEACRLLCCADLDAPPIALVVLSQAGGEFMTMSTHRAVFWRCAQDLLDGPWELQFQDAEVSQDPLPDTTCFTALCFLPGHLQLVLLGTSEGEVWIVDVDENQILSKLGVEDAKINSIACSAWPHFTCCSGQCLTLFELRWKDDELEAVPVGSPLHLDACVSSLQLSTNSHEGLAATDANTLWYVHLGEHLKVQLHSFHRAPSRMVRCSVSGVRGDQPPILATCADDGCVRLWTCEVGAQALVQFVCNAPCSAICFPSAQFLACALLDGSVCVFNLLDFSLHVQVIVHAHDSVLTLEALNSCSLVVGSAGGRLNFVRFDESACEGRDEGLDRVEELRADPAEAICAIKLDQEPLPSRFVVCSSHLKLRFWECGLETPVQFRTWSLPECRRPPSWALHLRDEADVLEMLSFPPVVASFVPPSCGSLVAVVAFPSTDLYVYDFVQDSVVAVVPMARPQNVVKLLPLPRAHDQGSATLLVLCKESARRVRLVRGGEQAEWLEEEFLWSGACSGVVRGTPDVCHTPCGSGDRLVFKDDAALYSWTGHVSEGRVKTEQNRV